MFLSGLSLCFFRKFLSLELEFSKKMNLFWGNNAQGKTSILESIYLFGLFKSFKTARLPDVISHTENKACVSGRMKTFGVDRNIEIFIEKSKKYAHLDGKPVRRIQDLVEAFRPLLFSSEEIDVVRHSPGKRRNFIDRAILQKYPDYLSDAQDFLRHLKQRNALLKAQSSEKELDPWTEGYIRAAARIRYRRFFFLKNFLSVFEQTYRKISGSQEGAQFRCSWEGSEIKEIENDLRSELKRRFRNERQLGMTLVGPHRDDIFFEIEGQSVKDFASQGQQRSFVLAFKLAQIEDIQNTFGVSPVFLLDDVTSELDRYRREYLFEFLHHSDTQVFVTTTEPGLFRDADFANADFFHVHEGKVDQKFK